MMIGWAGSIILPSARAGEWNQQTVVTLNTSVAVPGPVLAPGKYIFKFADIPSGRHVVQIFNEDRNQVIATVLTASASRTKPTSDTVITLEEQPNGGPEAIGKWFYPGASDGVEFLYLGAQRQR
jgi:hypothetical protein